MLSGTAHAGPSYPHLLLDDSHLQTATPAQQGFIDILADLTARGALQARAPQPGLPQLDGASAKAWLLDHVATDFRCERDFGGVCGSGGKAAHLANFTNRTAQFLPEFLDPAGLQHLPAGQLADVTLSLGRIAMPDVALSLQSNGDVCTATARVVDAAAYDQAVSRLQKGLGLEDAIFVEAGLLAVRGSWRVRQAPAPDAPIIGSVQDEVLYFPAPDHDLSNQGYRWRLVFLPNGTEGYIAADGGALLPLSALNGGGACIGMRQGRMMLTAHIGGGD